MGNKFRVEVIADRTGNWAGNAMKYDTFDEAKAAAIDLANRWLLVEKARVVEFDHTGDIDETIVF